MALRWRTRRRLALVVLVIGLPVYILLAAVVASWLGRPSVLVELAVYVGLGIVWIVPLRPLFRGIAAPEPEDERMPPESGPRFRGKDMRKGDEPEREARR